MTKKNNNIWDGKFKSRELKLYPNLNQRDINLIMDYQKQLPILQQDNDNGINARKLYEQLVGKKVKDNSFAKWIKRRIEKYDFIINEDYKILWLKDNIQFDEGQSCPPSKLDKNNENQMVRNGYKKEYLLTLSMAKELSMIENNETGRLARKYFITIEKAFKSRYEWNKDRLGSIEQFKNLRKIVFKDLYGENRLGDFVPRWWRLIENKTGLQNTYAYELYRLDLIIIGKSAQQYRKEHNLKNNTIIRNTFNERQLEEFELLQGKSAEYLLINKVWNTEERMRLLKDWLELHREGKLL